VVDDEGSNLGGGRKEARTMTLLCYISTGSSRTKSFRVLLVQVYISYVFVYVYRSRGQMWVIIIIIISGKFSLGTLRTSVIASLSHNFTVQGSRSRVQGSFPLPRRSFCWDSISAPHLH